jgi:hypothetical protein
MGLMGNQEEQQHDFDRDAIERRDWGRRQDDRLLLHIAQENRKRIEKLEAMQEARRIEVDNAFKKLEDHVDSLSQGPDGPIYLLKEANTAAKIRFANLKFILTLAAGSGGAIGMFIGAGDKIRIWLKGWLT